LLNVFLFIQKIRYLFSFPLLFISSIICISVPAQESLPATAKVKIASPEAAALGKYVDIPVNYHTGIPNISIPFYTVKSGTLTMPIGISYHAGGLKLQEQASYVGAGWALNAGGMITRTVRGAPDEKKTGSSQQYYGYFSDYGYLNYLFKQSDGTALSTSTYPSGQEFYTGNYDGEPDLFFFNFNGYSGKFYFNDDRTPVLVPEQDIKIEYDYTPGQWNGGPGAYGSSDRCIEGFIITIPDGTKYYFGMTGSSPTGSYVHPIEVTCPYSLRNGYTYSRSISSWYLNKIVSADGEFTIQLNYTRDRYAYYVVSATTKYGQYDGSNTTDVFDLIKNYVDGVKLSNVTFASGKVDFTPGAAREDLSNWPGTGVTIVDAINQNSKTLGSIKISDNSEASACKKFNFTYSYFSDASNTALPSFTGTIDIQTDKKRLKLESIQEVACDGSVNIPPYAFSYFTENVPRTLSFGMDHWGFINGANGNADLLPSLTRNGIPYLTTTDNRNSSWPAMRAGTLKKIVFPTGGNNEYEYEANKFTVNNNDQDVGGLRILKITQHDAVDVNNNIVTNFDYTNSTNRSSGILFSKPVYIQKLRNDMQMDLNVWSGVTPDGCPPQTEAIYQRHSLQPMQTTQGSHIGYEVVKVKRTNNGTSMFRYSPGSINIVDHSCIAITNVLMDGSCTIAIPNYPAAPLPNDFLRGELIYEGYFTEAGNKISEKEYYPQYQENPITTPGCIFTTIGDLVLPTFYELKTAKKISNRIVERTFGMDGIANTELTSETFCESNYHHQPTRSLTTYSTGKTTEQKFKYPQDFIVPTFYNNIPVSNYSSYTNAVNSFPSNYQAAMNQCSNYTGLQRSLCLGDVWYNQYLRAVSTARVNYINYRKTNFLNSVNTYQTNHDFAKASANSELSTILWMQDGFVHSPVEESHWKNSKLLKGAYTLFNNKREDQFGIYPEKVFTLDVTAPTTSFTSSAVASDNISIARDSRYKESASFDFTNGVLIGIANRSGINTGYEWKYNKALPVVKIVNAYNRSKVISQPGLVTKSTTFYIGGSAGTTSSINSTFIHIANGPITISIPEMLPTSAQATASYTLSGPSGYYQTGYLCAAGSGASSCGGALASITYNNMQPGTYTITGSVNTNFSTHPFNYSLSQTYNGKVLIKQDDQEFFFEGFEEDIYPQTTGVSHTGKKYWNSSSFQVNYTRPNSRNYVMQWWALSNGIWTLNQQSYTSNSATLYGAIDDIRIFPADAQMVTYTYDPMKGITSETDPNGKSIYYEYDVMNRLKIIKDNAGNFLQTFCYNYAGQVGSCSINTMPNWQLTGNTRCKPCPSNSQYNSNVLQQERKDINPNSSTYNQTEWIDNGTSSSCGLASWQNLGSPYCEVNSSSQNTGNQLQLQRDMNPCSATYNQTQVVLIGYNPSACPLPASCDYSNCNGEEYRCVYGSCELGYKIYTESYYDWSTGAYICVYHYEWSDGVWSQDYQEYSNGRHCAIQ